MGSQELNIFLQFFKICNFFNVFLLNLVYSRKINSNGAKHILDKVPNQHMEKLTFKYSKCLCFFQREIYRKPP